MYIALIVIHCLMCLVLIAAILLQAGRGGGLTEAFGGGGDAMQSVLGTQAPAFLKKATTVSAIAFLVTSILLGMITARRGKSLFDERWSVGTSSTQAASPAAAPPVPSEASGAPETVNN